MLIFQHYHLFHVWSRLNSRKVLHPCIHLDSCSSLYYQLLQVNLYFQLNITNFMLTFCYRALGNLSPSLYLSQQFMGLLFILLLTYVGYFPPRSKMVGWVCFFITFHLIQTISYLINSSDGFTGWTLSHTPSRPSSLMK